jgi:hypothetical protein
VRVRTLTPRGWKPHSHSVKPSQAVKASIDVVEFYDDFVLGEYKAKMQEIEVEVLQMREFQEDTDVEFQVGGFIPNLGCTRTINLKFYHTLELYWYIKPWWPLVCLPRNDSFFN